MPLFLYPTAGFVLFPWAKHYMALGIYDLVPTLPKSLDRSAVNRRNCGPNRIMETV